MVELDQYKYQWNQYKDSVKELEASFNIEVKKERLEEILETIRSIGRDLANIHVA